MFEDHLDQEVAGAEDLYEDLLLLATASSAIDLRLGRMLAWFKVQDLKLLGYSSFVAFRRERVDVNDTRQKQLTRLAASRCEGVKAAVSAGLISIEVAAAGIAEAEFDEETWLYRQLQRVDLNCRWRRSGRAEPIERVDLEGEDLATVNAARRLVRILVGRSISDATVDATLVQWWKDDRSGQELLEAARQDPSAPVHEPLPDWADQADPATELLGPWQEPADLQEGLRQLEEVLRVRRHRTLWLGRLWIKARGMDLHKLRGFDSLAEWDRSERRVSLRTLQRAAELAEVVDYFPQVAEAVDTDQLRIDHARQILRIADEDSVDRWMNLARHTTAMELERAVDQAFGGVEDTLLATYEHTIDVATGSVGTDKPLKVSLRIIQEPLPDRGWETAPKELLLASKWLLETVQLEPQRGFGKVKERDRFRCQNPECWRVGLRHHAHHIRARQDGGSDDLDNGVCVCRACHLRLIHGGIVEVYRQGPLLVWDYPDRRVAVMLP